jgi:hypothetical protein
MGAGAMATTGGADAGVTAGAGFGFCAAFLLTGLVTGSGAGDGSGVAAGGGAASGTAAAGGGLVAGGWGWPEGLQASKAAYAQAISAEAVIRRVKVFIGLRAHRRNIGIQSTGLRLKRKFQARNCRQRPTQIQGLGQKKRKFCEPLRTAAACGEPRPAPRGMQSGHGGLLPLFTG